MQQGFGLLWVVVVIFQIFVGAPDARWQDIFRDRAGAFKYRLDYCRFVDRHRQRLAHFDVIGWRLSGVKRQEAGIQTRLLFQGDIRVSAHLFKIGGIRERHHLTLVLLQLGITHGGIRRDAEHQPIELRLALPVVRERFVENAGIFLILHQLKRSGADRVHIDLLRRPRFQHRVCIFRRVDRGEVPGEIGKERRFRMGQRKTYGVVIDPVDTFNQRGELQAFEVGIGAARDIVVGIFRVHLAHKREDHIVGVEVAAGFEGFIALKLHILAQIEGVNRAIRADFPAFRQAGHQIGRAGRKVHQPVKDRHRTGVNAGPGGIELRVKVLWRSFRTEDQRFGVNAASQRYPSRNKR